jgi:hypothetical protein
VVRKIICYRPQSINRSEKETERESSKRTGDPLVLAGGRQADAGGDLPVHAWINMVR